MLTPLLPANDWRNFENSVNDLVSSVFGKPIFSDRNTASAAAAAWWPRIDVVEQENAYEIHADIPGVEPSNVKLAVDGGKLTISGERNSQSENNSDRVHRCERSYGKFLRTFALPEGANPEDIKADFKHGVLTVNIPKPTATAAREIAINVSEA